MDKIGVSVLNLRTRLSLVWRCLAIEMLYHA